MLSGLNMRKLIYNGKPNKITTLNDFIFCPASIYFHMLDSDTEKLTYQTAAQLNGAAAHKQSDSGKYSSKKSILQSMYVYSNKYDIVGKIDTFDVDKGLLTERKNKIGRIFDGYIFQLYAQYFSLKEMGYDVKEICLYSMSDNKRYKIRLPEHDGVMLNKFENTILQIKSFSLEGFKQENSEKCSRCIYEPLCAYSLL